MARKPTPVRRITITKNKYGKLELKDPVKISNLNEKSRRELNRNLTKALND